MQRKNRSGRWTVSPTGHKKGGGIQGISAASAARAETLSDALGTRLIPELLNFLKSKLNRIPPRRMRKAPHDENSAILG